MHHDVDLPQSFPGLFHQEPWAVPPGEVGANSDAPASRVPSGRHDRLGFLTVPMIPHRDPGAEPSEAQGDRAADAARTPGDHGAFPSQLHPRTSLSLSPTPMRAATAVSTSARASLVPKRRNGLTPKGTKRSVSSIAAWQATRKTHRSLRSPWESPLSLAASRMTPAPYARPKTNPASRGNPACPDMPSQPM